MRRSDRIATPWKWNGPSSGNSSPRWRLSIRIKLLIAVNAVSLVGLAILLMFDYERGVSERLYSKQVAMSEEAALVLSAVDTLEHHGIETVQEYIDSACAQMQDSTSPGHHIAVELGERMLQAQTHQRASPAFAYAMRLAATAADHRASVGGEPILVGARRHDHLQVYVSEFSSNIREAARAQLLSRAGGIALVGLTLTAVVNLVLLRLVTRPIDRLVRTVRRIGGGEFDSAPPRFTTTELDYLAAEIGEMGRSLDIADRQRRRQMAKARQIQEHLLPHPDQLEAVGIQYVHSPAEDVGGDFFDVKVLDERRLAIYMGDVTGHGVPAAMSVGMLKTLFEHSSENHLNPTAVLQQINRRLHAVTLSGEFATMFMGVVDRCRGRLLYASAGHEICYLLRASGDIEELKPTGLLLGVDPDAACELVVLTLAPGDMVVLFTDGLVEAMSPQGQLLGRSAVLATLASAHGGPPSEIAARLLDLAETHRGGRPQHDDIMLALLQA